MTDERDRRRLEHLGIINPEPIMPTDTERMYPLPPASTQPTSRLDAIRVPTIHEPYRPLCPRCHRPYNPDSRLQKSIVAGCTQCASLDPASLAAQLERLWELDMAALIQDCPS